MTAAVITTAEKIRNFDLDLKTRATNKMKNDVSPAREPVSNIVTVKTANNGKNSSEAFILLSADNKTTIILAIPKTAINAVSFEFPQMPHAFKRSAFP